MKDMQPNNDELIALEKSLRLGLHPVKPDQDFVGNLRSRLENSPVYQQQRETAYSLLTVAVGLLVGLIIFLVGKGFLQELSET